MLEFDFSILNFIQDNLRSAIGDCVMPFISALGNLGLIWICLAAVMLLIPKYRKSGIVMLIALALHICLCNLLIKPLVARPRPFTINTDIRLLITAPTDYSFPSGHTAASFAVAFSLLFGKNKLCSLAFILSALIAFSRLYLYVHYPTDVFAGILIGCFIGLISNAVYTAVSSRVKPVIPKGKAEQ